MKRTIIHKISSVLNVFSCISIFILMAMITMNVILRAVFKSPIKGVFDYTGFLTIILIGCGLAYCYLDNGHIEISFFTDKMGSRLKKAVILSGRILSFACMSIFSYSLVTHAAKLFDANEVSVTTKTPIYIFVYITAFCFLIFSLSILFKIFENSSREDKNGS